MNTVVALDRATERANRPLTPPEAKFVLEYIVDFDEARACMAVYGIGSNPTIVGRRMLSDPAIMSAIAKELEAQGEALFLQKKAIISRVWREALDMNNRAGERIRALELVARLIGALDSKAGSEVPRVSITINDPHNVMVQREDSGANFKEAVVIEDPVPVIDGRSSVTS